MHVQGSQRLRDWINGGETRRLGGHRVFMRTAFAEGRPPLLLIHDYPTASYDWVRVWPRLAAHERVVDEYEAFRSRMTTH
jgi:pimeloyl-ACP methyl ester carboxylesterase